MTPFQKHVAKWSDCQRCPLCETRRKVVLCRGQLPCTVLFIGESPGFGEDAVGLPFVGPAGRLLDDIIAKASYAADRELRIAFTNVVACLPKNEEGNKVSDPPPEAIKACAPRLDEIVQIARPKVIISVGKVSDKQLEKNPPLFRSGAVKFSTITHPAAILQANAAQQGLMVQKTIVTLSEIFSSLPEN